MPSLAAPLTLLAPPRIDVGFGAAAKLGAYAEAVGRRRILVVADRFNAGRVERLGLAGDVTLFGAVDPEPDTANLDALLAVAQAAEPDLVIGFGGGSAMDLAKLAAVLPGSGQSLADVVGAGRVAGPRRPGLVQVPTTAGTGSEAGTRALVTDKAARAKRAVESVHMLADLAVIDPDLTLSVPPAVTAATGVDAMAHCVEAYTSRRSHPVVDVHAAEGIRLVGRHLGAAVRDGATIEARAGLALAALYGGFCLGPVNTTAGHALAYPLGTRWGVPHGAANALIFPHVLAFNAPAVPEKTALITAALGGPATAEPAAVFDVAHRFCAGLGIEMRLSGLGVARGDLDAMAADAHQIRRLLDNNPRDLTVADIRAIYDAAY